MRLETGPMLLQQDINPPNDRAAGKPYSRRAFVKSLFDKTALWLLMRLFIAILQIVKAIVIAACWLYAVCTGDIEFVGKRPLMRVNDND